MGQIGNCAGLLALPERAKWPQQVQALSSKMQNLPCRIPPDHPSGAPSRALSARENGRHCHMEWSVGILRLQVDDSWSRDHPRSIVLRGKVLFVR